MVEYPQNDFTRMIEAVTQGNVSGQRGGGVASATPLPTVRSADLGREVPQEPMPLEEKEELDRLAREAGIKDPRIGTGTEGEPDVPAGYASMEEALAAGTAVEAPKTLDTRGLYVRPGRVISVDGRPATPRLPDFRNVEGIDLVRNVCMIDGMTFPIGPDSVAEFKQFVVTTAHAAILEKLNEAMSLLSPPVEVEEPSDETEGGNEPLS